MTANLVHANSLLNEHLMPLPLNKDCLWRKQTWIYVSLTGMLRPEVPELFGQNPTRKLQLCIVT